MGDLLLTTLSANGSRLTLDADFFKYLWLGTLPLGAMCRALFVSRNVFATDQSSIQIAGNMNVPCEHIANRRIDVIPKRLHHGDRRYRRMLLCLFDSVEKCHRQLVTECTAEHIFHLCKLRQATNNTPEEERFIGVECGCAHRHEAAIAGIYPKGGTRLEIVDDLADRRKYWAFSTLISELSTSISVTSPLNCMTTLASPQTNSSNSEPLDLGTSPACDLNDLSLSEQSASFSIKFANSSSVEALLLSTSTLSNGSAAQSILSRKRNLGFNASSNELLIQTALSMPGGLRHLHEIVAFLI